MTINRLSEEIDDRLDPRAGADYCPQHFPSVNGKDAPTSPPPDRNSKILFEFAVSYYQINRQYAELLQVRRLPDPPDRQAQERAQMQRIEQALRTRDVLEDQYAPLGVIVEPVMKDGFAVDLKCSFGDVDASGRPRSELVTIAASVPVPFPREAKLEDFLVRVEVPGGVSDME